MSPWKDRNSQDIPGHHEVDSASTRDHSNDSQEERSTHTGDNQPRCSICHSTFRRPEHLKRHFRSHTKEKPFKCARCGRYFSRTDTLHRHELSHHSLGIKGTEGHAHRITVKTFRACFKCAVARVRCSGGMPCGRCENRSLECQYPTERRSKTKGQKESSSNASPVLDGALNTSSFLLDPPPLADDVDANLKPSDGPVMSRTSNFGMTQAQVQLPGRSVSDAFSGSSNNLNVHNVLPGPHDDVRETGASHTPNANRIGTAVYPSFRSYDMQNQPHAYPGVPTSDIRNTRPHDDGFPVDSFTKSQPRERAENKIALGTTVSGLQQTSLGSDEPNFSTINWLSNDMYQNETNRKALRSNALAQGPQTGGSLSQTVWLPPVVGTGPIEPSLDKSICQEPHRGSSTSGNLKTPDNFAQNGTQPPVQSSAKRSTDDCMGDARPPSKYNRTQSLSSKQPASSGGVFSWPGEENADGRFSFPAIHKIQHTSDEQSVIDFPIEPSTYDSIYRSFVQLCCADSLFYSKFDSTDFLPANALSSFIRVYFEAFQPIYPIFHAPTYNPNNTHWSVILAISAIGCQTSGFHECTAAMNEFLRRAIAVERERYRSEQTPLWLLQAMMLNCVGLAYGANEKTRASALNSFGDLVTLVSRERLLYSVSRPNTTGGEDTHDTQWSLWIEDEVKRRTAYFVWLLDCTLAYHFDSRPSLSLEDGQAALPSHESLWQAKSAGTWKQLVENPPGPVGVSLYDAVLIMYIEKRLVPGIGDFTSILLTHALNQRTWEVGDYFRRPLSFWGPTAKKQSRDAAIPSSSIWLPGIPSYSKWRNSACDCLDILQWMVNGTKAPGPEHPIFLHLHTARIVLLTPFREIRSLATSIVTGQIGWTQRQQSIEWHYILRWIQHDQYKARLAIVHAGSCLSHVRSHSTNAFHEPVAAFLSILTLWAYGMCRPQAFNEPTLTVEPTSRQTTKPSYIHLDHPCDDELVQSFVRDGQAMSGIVTGAGDICGPHGPKEVLRAGCKLLSDLNSWGISWRLIATLTKLAELML